MSSGEIINIPDNDVSVPDIRFIRWICCIYFVSVTYCRKFGRCSIIYFIVKVFALKSCFLKKYMLSVIALRKKTKIGKKIRISQEN